MQKSCKKIQTTFLLTHFRHDSSRPAHQTAAVYKQLTQAQYYQWQRWHPIGSVLLLLALIDSVSVEKEIAVQTTSDLVSLHLPLELFLLQFKKYEISQSGIEQNHLYSNKKVHISLIGYITKHFLKEQIPSDSEFICISALLGFMMGGCL